MTLQGIGLDGVKPVFNCTSMLRPGERPRLPYWAHVSQSTDGPTNVYGDAGGDNLDEVLAIVRSKVQKAADMEAKATTINLRPVGVAAGSHAAEVVRLAVEDRFLGLTDAQVARIGKLLGDSALTRCVELRVSFENAGGAMTHGHSV
ncbi:MAG TPA: hypothetical protein VHK47_20190 [Polyangia bacterium]|nr:hypothetical protein [Polyangia bacterium]